MGGSFFVSVIKNFRFQNGGWRKMTDRLKVLTTQKRNTINIRWRTDQHPYSDRQTCSLKSYWQQRSRAQCIIIYSEADTLNLASSVLFCYRNTAGQKSISQHSWKTMCQIVADNIFLLTLMSFNKDNLCVIYRDANMRCIVTMHINPTTTCHLQKLATVVFCSGSSLNLNMDNGDRDGGKSKTRPRLLDVTSSATVILLQPTSSHVQDPVNNTEASPGALGFTQWRKRSRK